MTGLELMKKIDGADFQTDGTVDCFKFGDSGKEIKKVATCLTASVNVIKEALKWGAELIISHEPTYYTHVDEINEDSIIAQKKVSLVKEAGIPICRFHDHMHFGRDDMISKGFLKVMGWEDKGVFDGNCGFIFNDAKSPLEIAAEVEKKLDIKRVRIVGARDGKVTKIGLFLGHRGNECWGKLVDEDVYELALGGEWCEWHDGERVRDSAEFGLQKTALLLGHAASERAAMKFLSDDINENFASEGIEAKYFECGELFTYID